MEAIEANDAPLSMKPAVMASIQRCDTCMRYERLATAALSELIKMKKAGTGTQDDVYRYASAGIYFLGVVNNNNASDFYTSRIAKLEELFASLPGLGPRSAARLVSDLLTSRRAEARAIKDGLEETLARVHHCPRCHTLTTEPVCDFCSDATRDNTRLCVVESVADQKALEASLSYRGGYFVLMGRINPLEGTEPERLGVSMLLQRIHQDQVSELILATSYTPEGDVTAHMIAGIVRKHFPEVRVTRLSKGLPTGVELEYADVASIASAVFSRR